MILEPDRELLLADLCMAVQGFRPSRDRLDQLCAQGLLWQMPTKPATFGMTEEGKEELLSILSSLIDGDKATAYGAAKAAKRLAPTVEEFTQGVSFLDDVERGARTGQIQAITNDQLTFTIWLVEQLSNSKS